MTPIADMVLRISVYAPLAVLDQTYRLVDQMDGPGETSNPEIVGWDAGAIGLPAPTREQLAAIVLPSPGTRFEARIDAFLLRRDDDALLIQGIIRCLAKGQLTNVTLATAVAQLKAEIKPILDG